MNNDIRGIAREKIKLLSRLRSSRAACEVVVMPEDRTEGRSGGKRTMRWRREESRAGGGGRVPQSSVCPHRREERYKGFN